MVNICQIDSAIRRAISTRAILAPRWRPSRRAVRSHAPRPIGLSERLATKARNAPPLPARNRGGHVWSDWRRYATREETAGATPSSAAPARLSRACTACRVTTLATAMSSPWGANPYRQPGALFARRLWDKYHSHRSGFRATQPPSPPPSHAGGDAGAPPARGPKVAAGPPGVALDLAGEGPRTELQATEHKQGSDGGCVHQGSLHWQQAGRDAHRQCRLSERGCYYRRRRNPRRELAWQQLHKTWI